MGYRNRELINIDSEKLVSEMNEAGYSIRKMSKEIEVDRKTIMKYLKLGQMPAYIFGKIMETVKNSSSKVRVYRFVWMRLGVQVPVTEDELLYIMNRAHRDHVENLEEWARADGMNDYDLSENEAEVFLKRAMIDGESYIPEVCFDEHLEWWKEKNKERD